MANQVPEKLINFRVYSEGDDMLGVADVELPTLESMTETMSGAGLAGEVDSPTLGHYGSLVLTLNWRTVGNPLLKFAAQRTHELDLRGANQIFDAGSGTHSVQAVRVTCRGIPKSIGLGSLGVAVSAGASTAFEVLQLRVYIDGSQVVELDKYNFKNDVSGTDYLQDVRNALGLS